MPEQAIEEAKQIKATLEGMTRTRRRAKSTSRGSEIEHRLPGRSPAEIRRDIDLQRQDLGRSVEALRGRVAELTDWRRQVREHRSS